jgi:thiol-disulfide isomerase/thioredoxin
MDIYGTHKWKVAAVVVIVTILVYLFMDGGYAWIQKQLNGGKEGFQDSPRNILYIFYADWCGYCKKAKPDFEKIAEHLRSNQVSGKKIEARMVNGDNEADLTKEFDVKGYPTVILVKDNRRYTYEGSRTEKEIMTYLETMMRE